VQGEGTPLGRSFGDSLTGGLALPRVVSDAGVHSKEHHASLLRRGIEHPLFGDVGPGWQPREVVDDAPLPDNPPTTGPAGTVVFSQATGPFHPLSTGLDWTHSGAWDDITIDDMMRNDFGTTVLPLKHTLDRPLFNKGQTMPTPNIPGPAAEHSAYLIGFAPSAPTPIYGDPTVALPAARNTEYGFHDVFDGRSPLQSQLKGDLDEVPSHTNSSGSRLSPPISSSMSLSNDGGESPRIRSSSRYEKPLF